MTKTYKVEGVVLKRVNIGEGDRIITLFTRQRGKVVGIAKGVRKLTSKRSGSLEIATRGEFFFYQGKYLDILTQAQFLSGYQKARQNLIRITQLHQVLEIIDLLTVENEPAPEVYQVLISTLEALEQPQAQKKLLLRRITKILRLMGFTHDKPFTESGLKHYIEELANRKLRSKDYLSPQTKKISKP